MENRKSNTRGWHHVMIRANPAVPACSLVMIYEAMLNIG